MNSKPIIVVSKCLGFDKCRYNGDMFKNEFIEKLSNHVTIKTVCPEVGIGLPTPRNTLRLVNIDGKSELIEPKNNVNYSNLMFEFAEDFHFSNNDIDAFILKSRSPSCGTKDVKIYSSNEKGSSSSKGRGLFASIVYDKYPLTIIEEDGRLTNYAIRENFLISIFTKAKFKDVKKINTIESLIEFHKQNALLIKSFNIKEFNYLSKLIENKNNLSFTELLENYEDHLFYTLSKSARYTSHISVVLDVISTFKDKISKDELNFLEETVNKYKTKHLPLSALINTVKSYLVRFNLKDILNQTYFNPYPEDLIEFRDSGKGV